MPRQDLAPHVYNIVSRDGYHLKTDEMYINIKLRILKRNANGVYDIMPPNESIVPVNNFLYSAFKVNHIFFSVFINILMATVYRG
jgi:hypothetical protein